MQNNHWFGILSVVVLAFVLASCVQPASDEIAPTQVGANATWTHTPPPTNTPTITPTATATPESESEATEPATASPTATPTPTDAQSAFIAQSDDATLVAQDDTNPIDSGGQNQTDPNAQVSSSQLTATAIIAGATATQSFILTATSDALFGATATPTASPTVDPLAGGANATAPPANLVAGQDCFHEVKAQDQSLYRLSLAYGLTVNEIASASGIVNPDLIRVGQMLTIPGCGTTGGVPPATSTPNPAAVGTGGAGNTTGTGGAANPTGDCSWGTSVRFPNGCPTAGGNTGAANTGAGAATGTGGPGTTAGSRTHRVAQGETLYEISLTYNVPMDQIAAANGITNYDSIRFNSELVIP